MWVITLPITTFVDLTQRRGAITLRHRNLSSQWYFYHRRAEIMVWPDFQFRAPHDGFDHICTVCGNCRPVLSAARLDVRAGLTQKTLALFRACKVCRSKIKHDVAAYWRTMWLIWRQLGNTLLPEVAALVFGLRAKLN